MKGDRGKKKVAMLNEKAEELEEQRKDERRQRHEGNAVAWVGTSLWEL